MMKGVKIDEKVLTAVLGLVLAMVLALSHFPASGQGDGGPQWGPYLTLKDGTTVVVNWKTDGSDNRSLDYDLESYYLERDQLGESARVESRGAFRHARLRGLKPGRQYVYRIDKEAGRMGINYFGSPDKGPSEFSFFVYGDSRTCPRKHRLVASEMAMDPLDPSFIVHTGDLVERPLDSNWDDFFWAIEPFSKSTPLVPALGNHERNDDSYYRAFDLPSGGGDYKEQWYSFTHGRAKVIVLDSNTGSSGLSKQRNWLIGELRANRKPVTVVVFHHPIYSSIYYSTGVNKTLADTWGDLFARYGVDLVFNGHVHSYERAVKDGVTYVVTGGGGAPTDNLSSGFDFSRKAVGDSLHYVRVIVRDNEVKLETVEVARVDRSGRSGRLGCNVGMEVDRTVLDEAVIPID
jgi:hypothetical protein